MQLSDTVTNTNLFLKLEGEVHSQFVLTYMQMCHPPNSPLRHGISDKNESRGQILDPDLVHIHDLIYQGF